MVSYNKKYITFNLYLQAARSGHIGAMHEVAVSFHYGEGTVKDDSLAFKWYCRAVAAGGNSLSMYCIGLMYQFGQYVKKDIAEAIVWYGKAALLGNEYAAKKLAHLPTGYSLTKH